MDVQIYTDKAFSMFPKYVGDSDLHIKSSSVIVDQGFKLRNIPALSDCKDVTINNYSCMFLTNKIKGSKIFTIDQLNCCDEIITSYLIVDGYKKTSSLVDAQYVYFNPPTQNDATGTTLSLLSATQFINNEANSYFDIELLDFYNCRINHRHNTQNWFLAVSSVDTAFHFVSGAPNVNYSTLSANSAASTVFQYIIDRDSQKLSLIKKLSSTPYKVSLSAGQLVLDEILTGPSGFDSSSVFSIRYINTVKLPQLNTSWISYDIDSKGNTVNYERSRTNIPTNYLGTFQYSAISGRDVFFNFINLKNNRSETDVIKRGSVLESSSDATPKVQFREYNSLHTGTNQEKGNDKITISYDFYDKDYLVNPGNTIIESPSNMYPYTQININDSCFIDNGSIGGHSPYTSDRIYRTREESYTNNADGQYLCTWLSAGNVNSRGVWVDRYYYPNKSSIINALTTTNIVGGSGQLLQTESGITLAAENNVLLTTEDGPISNGGYTDPIDILISQNIELSSIPSTHNYLFDKKSELLIEPNSTYIYYRLNDKFVSQYVDSIQGLVLNTLPLKGSSGNVEYSTIDSDTKYHFNNNRYYQIQNYNKVNELSEFTFSFELSKDNWNIPFGHSLIGNLNDTGFGIINECKVTPFIYTFSADRIYVYNTDFKLLHYIQLDGEVKEIIHGETLDKFFAITQENSEYFIYTLHTNGVVVKKKNLNISSYTDFYNTRNEVYIKSGNTIVVYNSNDNSIRTIISDSEYNSAIVTENGTTNFLGNGLLPLSDFKVLYIYNNILYEEVYDKIATPRNQLITTASSLSSYCVDKNGNILLISGNGEKVTKVDAGNNITYSTSLSGLSGKGISVSYVQEFSNTGVKHYPVFICKYNDSDNMFAAKLDESTLTFTSSALSISASAAIYSHKYHPTNFNYLNKLYDNSNNLNFKLVLVNKFNNLDVLEKNVVVPLSSLDAGSHHFACVFDSAAGQFSVYLNGLSKSTQYFDSGKYIIKNIFNDTLCIGASHFYNNIILSNYLLQPNYYYCNDVTLSKFSFYNRALPYDDIRMHLISTKKMNPLVLNIPCGQRNNLDQMERIFKLGGHTSKARDIDIVIKNLQIDDKEAREQITQEIISKANKVIPASVSINNIKFINF